MVELRAAHLLAGQAYSGVGSVERDLQRENDRVIDYTAYFDLRKIRNELAAVIDYLRAPHIRATLNQPRRSGTAAFARRGRQPPIRIPLMDFPAPMADPLSGSMFF